MIHPTVVIGNSGFNFDKTKPRKQKQCPFDVKIGNDVHIKPFCNIDAGIFRHTRIGNNVIIDAHTYIAHDCLIGDNVEINSHVTILGECEIGDGSRICAGAIIHQKVKVGKNCVVGANSYLRHDLPDNSIAYGSPAKVVQGTKYGEYLKNFNLK